MAKLKQGLFPILLLFSLFLALGSTFSFKNFELTDSNQGADAHYVFSFTPDLSYQSVQLVITFPIQYSISAFAGSLECYFSRTGVHSEYNRTNCWVQPDSTANTLYLLGSVVVNLAYANSTQQNFVLLKNIKNPPSNISSYFQVSLRKNGVKIETEKYFAKAIFTNPATVSSLGVSITPAPNPAYIGRGTTYTFSFNVSAPTLAYINEYLYVRIKLDTDFSSDGPLCALGDYNNLGYKNQFVPTASSILPATLNQVDCGPVSNLQSLLGPNNELIVKIDNMLNPLTFESYSNTKIQIMRSLRMQPIQTISFPTSTIQIMPQNISVSIKQSNYMRMSTNVYYFNLNHYTQLNQSSSITIEFLSNTWLIHNGLAMFGFSSPSTTQYIITGNKIVFYHYGVASHQVQQVLGVNLTSFNVSGTYPVKVTTQMFNQTLGQWTGTVLLNQTIGTFNLLSVSAVQAATKLPVDSTGPLQMTFFLNYELPPSDDVPNGTLQITIFPQIPEPDPQINGVVKCYWKGTLQAADCTYDNSFPNKTIITLVSPPHDAFKYSQIPVIITTEGGRSTEDLGLTIDPLVQRYRFECEFHLYNSSSIPSQVFYTTWIADAIELTTNLVMATTHQCNQWTHLQINMTTPLLDSSLQKQFRIMIQFLHADGSAWANSVGYEPDKIYQRYPCVVVGLVGTNIHCDLYTFYNRETPYSNMHINNNVSGPYILIYGFDQNVPTGVPVRIQIPKIKVGSLAQTSAYLGISILQQTPGQKQPYVQLYFQDLFAFTTKNPINIPLTNVASSQLAPIQIQTNNQYHVSWNPILPSTVKYIMYQLTPQYLPSLLNKDAACNTNQCVGLGLPANWIVQTPASVGTPHVMDTIVNYVRAMDYLPQTQSFLPIRMTTYDGMGKTVNKYKMDIHYIAKPIMSSSFVFLETDIYSGLEQWYSIGFANTNSTLSDYPFMRFILANGLSFTDPPQCNSTTVMPYNESGIICVREDPQTMRVYNIKQLAPLGTYTMWFRMQTTLPEHTAPISPIVDIHINHNNSVDSSIVSLKQDQPLVPSPVLPLLSAPTKFQIHNPQIINEDIQIGYIGPVYLQFYSQIAGVFDIDVEFNRHLYNGGYWRTPTSNDLDPVVCLLNQIRYDCAPTNNPATNLKIHTLQTDVRSGLNQLRFDTEYIDPFNGIKFPDVPGMYSIKLTLTNSTSSASVTLYAQIQPPKFLHMQAGSIVKDIDTESVYKINFTLPSWHIMPNSYFDTVNRSRIIIQFPTLIQDQPVFTSNLGLYQGKFQERVGCYFKTGGQYITFAPTYTLQCRLIPSGKPGDPVKVEIINHAQFSAAQNSLSVYVFKVINPVISHSSVPITVKIDHIDTATGYIYPLYKQTYRVFLDPRPKNGAPVTYPSVDDPSSQFFEDNKDVGDYASILMNAHTVSGSPVTNPYYMLVKLPPYLDPEDNQIASAFSVCPPSAFQQCVSVPEINYLMVKVILNISQFKAVMKDYPISISLTNSYFYSNVIENGRFTGIIEYIISAAFRWQEIQGSIIYNYCQASGLQSKIVKSKQHFEVQISFTTTNFIPEEGTVQIGFPISITNVKPHCRSSVEQGSMLFTRSGNSGQIGCMVQNTNKWVITGFADVPPASTIIIRGQIDLPGTSGTIGMGHITTYADTNLIDIHTNGSRIDHIQTDFNMILIDSVAMNPIEDVFMTQRDVIRANFVGQFRILLQSDLPIVNTDTVTLKMAKSDIRSTSGGFTLSTRPHVCQFIRIDTNQQIGCKVISSIDDVSIAGLQCITYVLQSTQTLSASITYEIRLTTQSYSQPNLLEGIPYPTSPGTYRIETITTISGIQKTEHRYIQVYGPAFTQLKITQYNYLAAEYNLIWVQLMPTITITTEDQIILEFPTLSSNGTTMFDNNLGLNGYQDGDEVPVDVFDSAPLTNAYMKCRIYFGDQTRAVPARVVCGFLTSNLVTGSYLRFAFGFVNPPRITAPSIPSQLSLPILVYSYNPYYFEKTNFNLVNTAIFVYNGQQILAPNGYFSTLSNQLQYPNDTLRFANANTFPILVGDSYVMRFNFPLRVNDKWTGYCKNIAGTIIGTAYYHQKLRIIVCKMTAVGMPVQIAPLSASMMIQGFYTPWYRLADSQRLVHAIATYHSTSTSQVVNYFDPFPHLPPRWQFTSKSLLQLQGHLKHYVACQSDDYVFTVKLESPSSIALDLQYCKMISIHLPLTTIIDYFTLNTDCVEYPTSDIHVVRCNVDLSARAIFVEIVPGIYNNGMTIKVKTKDHALRNPCVFWNAFNILQFKVYFYSWENITYADSRSPDYAYMVMDTRNILPYTLTYVQQQYPAGLFSYYYTFDWIHTPHERTYNEFPQYTLDQYSPFSFDIWLTTALGTAPAGQFHKITLEYGLNYVTRNSQWTLDLNYDKTVCYLHNTRVQRCYLDTTNKLIYMQFSFAVPAGRPIHVYFSILDPRNPHYNGFRYNGTSDIDKVRVDLTSSAGTNYVFETQPFMAKETHVGGTGATLPQRGIHFATIDWATSMTGRLNVLDMTFYVNRSDITGLQFIIPQVNEINQVLYSANTRSAFFNINDGGQYPCGNNHPGVTGTGNPKCYIYNGDNTQMGFPTIITMVDFQYSAANIIKARILLHNPDIDMRWFTVKVRAFSGSPDSQTLYGHQYVGYWYFVNFFRTVPGTFFSSGWTNQATSYYLRPTKGNWRQQTTWQLTSSTPSGNVMAPLALGLGGYAILQVLLQDFTSGYVDDKFCQVDFRIGMSSSSDMLILKSKQSSYKKAYFIKKWATNPWSIQYFKCKHYGNGIKSYEYPSQIIMQQNFHSFIANSFYPYLASMCSITYFEYIEGRTLLQFNLSPMMNTLSAELFIWDEQVNYQLTIDLTFITAVTWTSVSRCYVTGGFQNQKGVAPVCSIRSAYAFTIINFQQILSKRDGTYVIKLEMDTNDISNIPNSLSANIALWANSDTTFIREFIYSTATSNSYSRSMTRFDVLSNGLMCGVAEQYTIYSYNTYSPNNLIVDILDFGMSSTTTLNIKLLIKLSPAASTFNMIMSGYNSYPWFRFYLEGYDYSCLSVNRMNLYYIDSAGNRNPQFATGWGGTGCSGNFFQVNFYSGHDIEGSNWAGLATFNHNQAIEVDVQLSISATEKPYLRDWIGIRTFMNTYFYRYCCELYDIWGNWICSRYYNYFYLEGWSQQAHSPIKLADSMSLSALSRNLGMPTQFIVKIVQIYPEIGRNNVDKLLLLQFNTGTQPFNYINTTLGNNHLIECRCITSWSPTFDPSTTVTPQCYLREPQLTFSNFAITIDIDVAPDQNLQCYFPGWVVNSPWTYTATAKLINEGSSFAPWVADNTVYGGFYWISSSVNVDFLSLTAPTALTVSQSPTIYSVSRVVNLPHTSSYQLTFSIPSIITDPLVYIDFQKSGFIPDQSFCSGAGITFCRVYNKYRNIMVVKFAAINANSVQLIKGAVNLQYPKHKQPGTNYDILVSMRNGVTRQYLYYGTLGRSDTQLLTTDVQFYCEPDKGTSTNLESYRTNIVLSFKLGGHAFFSTPNQGAKIVITQSSGVLLSTLRGCTAVSVDDPTFLMDCEVSSNRILITNPSYTRTLSVSGLIQVVVGISNPTVAITWTIKSYQYWFTSSNYGQQIQSTVVYTPNVEAGTEQKRSQMRMLPFNTKVYSTVHTPFRIAFKISNSPPSLPDDISYDLGHKMILKGFDALPSFTNFECLFKQYTLQPTQAPQSPLLNPYRNWKQNTQYIPLYAYCNKIGTNLQIEAPRTKPLNINNYYELVIMPTGIGLPQTGFNDVFDSQFRLITYPDSCQYIGEWMYYAGHMFKLNSIYLVTYRPLVDTALRLHFQFLFSSPQIFPNHYFEVHFQDINFAAIKAPYNLKGMRIPCTLSSQFVTAGRQNPPNCIINHVHEAHGDLVLRVTQIGNLPMSNSYTLSFDDFLLPDLSLLLQQSNQFSICMRYHKQSTAPFADVHHERCFEEIFVVDGVLDTIPVATDTGVFHNPPQNMYAETVTGKLEFAYPMTSTSTIDQKAMARVKGGYSATSPTPLSFGSHSLLWFNPELNLYILRQPGATATTLTNITMTGLINPQPYQKQEYSLLNTVQISYYNWYHPKSIIYYNQPPYQYFVLYTSKVRLQSTYISDIRTTIPTNSQSVVKMGILITDSVSELTRKLDDVFEITFDAADIAAVEECWVESVIVPVPYAKNGWCQTTSDRRVLLYNFYKSNVANNLVLFARLRHTATTIRMVTKLYSDNNEIQYNNTQSRTISKISLPTSPHPYLSFTQNYYTPYYFQQSIIPLTKSTICKYMHFSLNIPQDMIHNLTIFSITLPVTIIPSNLVEIKHKCQWLLVNNYNRQFHTGVYSHCFYLGGKIVVNAPFGGLLATRAGGFLGYLLRVRETDVINTRYFMPTTSKPQQILLGFNDTNIFKYDTLIIHPYEHFQSLNMFFYTQNIDELNTYHFEFIPAVSVIPGFQNVLELSIDTRYLVKDLGMPTLFANYGIDYDNWTRIDNLNYNTKYDTISKNWRNGMPYSCFTSTASLPNQTTVHTGTGFNNPRTRITHLLQTAYSASTKYVWKIPLLKNPSTQNLPFRMNLTLYTYHAANLGLEQKQLFYEIINHKFTEPNNPASFVYTLPFSNTIQSPTSNISVKFNSIGDVPVLGQHLQMKLNNQLTGIIDIDNLELYSEPDASYTFYFFPRVNLLIGHKTVTDFATVVDLGNAQISNEYADYYGYDWLKIHSSSSSTTVKKSGPVSKLLTNCIINPISAFTITQGLGTIKDSQFLLSFTFVSPICYIPRNSTMVVNYNSVLFESLINSDCYVDFREYTCIHSSGRIELTFYEQINAGRPVTIRVYLRAKGNPSTTTTLTGFIYGIPKTQFTKVIDFPNIGVLSILTQNLIDKPLFQHIQVQPIYELTQTDIRGTMIPLKPLTTIDITHPFTSSLASQQRMIMRKNSTSPYLFDYRTQLNWVHNFQTVVSNQQAIYGVPPNGNIDYRVLTGMEHTFILQSTYDVSGDFNNFTVGPVGNYYLFKYLTQNQIAYDEVYPIPVAEHLIVINPFTQISQQTAIGLNFFVTNFSIVPGNRITIQLDTHNLRYNMFRKTSQYPIECVERIKNIITWQPILVCEVTQRPTPAEPNKALIITVYPKLTINAGTIMEIWLSPIVNPDVLLVAGVTVRVDKNCNGEERCVIYESRGYYRTTTGMNMNTGLVGTFTPSVTEVLKTDVSHTFALQPDTYTAAFFRYPENYNTIMPLQCVESGGNTCLIFPTQKRVLTLLPNVSTSSITLDGMTNGIYLQPQSQFIDVLALTPTSSNLYNIPHNNLTTRRVIPATGVSTWMTINPTQTPGIFLRNYMNTATINIYGLYSTTFVNCFYINTPKEIVTWDTKYCNATFQSLNHDPYPTRLMCSFINDSTLQILIPEGVEENYLPNITQQFVMTVHAKFFIQDFAPGDGILYVTQPVISNTFNAYGSYSVPNHNYPFYITQASNTIVISEHRVPIIGKADFNTESFAQRFANVNEQTTFELLIDPKTQEDVKRIQLIIPEEFGYPPVGVHDACSLITTDTTHIANCYEIRRNNKTIVSLELVDTYDNGPRILKIGSKDIQSWFTAPPLPGSWYNMTVLLYSENGTLLEAQTTQNCSQIGGYDLQMLDMLITNGRDQNKNEIVDISFKVGKVSIRQGYPGSLSVGQYYTQIRLIFENLQAFDRYLGLNRSHGELTGCVTRNVIFNRQISCSLDVGLNINDEPYISVTGYEPIMPGTNVTISLSNILNLPANQRSTVSVAVMLKRIGDNKTAFLYNPTKKVLMSTSALSTTPPTQLYVMYNSPRVVNSPTILNFTITPTVDINSYFVLKFPTDALNDQYTLFNPACTIASRVEAFYRSDVVRIYPSTTHPNGTSRTYIITGFPSPKYSFSLTPYNITVEAYQDLKQVNTQIYTIPVLDFASCRLNFGIMEVTSPYTHQTEVTYILEFSINASFSSSQNSLTIGIRFPDSYGDVRSSNMTCEMNSNATCKFTRVNHLEITGTRETGQLIHRLTIRRVKNPETLNNTFYISSYMGQNLEQIICSGQASLTLLQSRLQNCSLDVTMDHSTKQIDNVYNFGLTCPDIIRNNSILYLKMPYQYSYNNLNSVSCWADARENLLTDTCHIKYINGSFYLQVTDIVINKNEKIIGINAKINNPIATGNYDFSARLQVSNYTYAQSTIDNITIYEGTPSTMQSVQIVNLPKESGLQSFYFIRVPTSSINTSLEIGFPPQFQLPSEVSVEKFTSNSSFWASSLKYTDMLKLSGTALDSQVGAVDNLKQKLTIQNTDSSTGSQGSWTYFMIKSITNPAYQSGLNFTLDSYYNFGNEQKLLKSTFEFPLPYTLNPPSYDVLHTNISVVDNDVLYFTDYTLTYRLSYPLQTNSTSFIIQPPLPDMNYGLLNLNCCLVVNSSTTLPYNYCARCEIIGNSFKFSIGINGIRIPADSDFQVKLSKLYNPPNATDCTIFNHHKLSYFSLKLLKNDLTATHTTTPPSSTQSPCQKYRLLRADILPILPDTLYAGMVHKYTIRLSQPTKMLRVSLNSSDPFVHFVPDIVYFPNYDVVEVTGSIVVDSIAQNNSKAYVNVTHIQSGTFDFFRPNLPVPIQVVADHKEYVIVMQQQAKSVGYDITVPINLTRASAVDMYLQLSVSPNDPNLIFKQRQILLPAFSTSSSLTFRYDGKTIPSTLNISMTLKSSYPLVHELQPPTVYFYFSISPEHNTLPSVMSARVMHQYMNNSMYAGRTVYHYNDTGYLFYDRLLPLIIKHQDESIGSTSADVVVYTREQCNIAYLVYQYGDHLTNLPKNPQEIRAHPNSSHLLSLKNSSFIVNPYSAINLTTLQQQTKYFIYMMAYSSLGNSEAITTHIFTTKVLSNAASFKLTTRNFVETDEVKIVRELADILKIDPYRIKVISSEKRLERSFSNANYQNQPYYDHQIVISPSTTKDDLPPSQVVMKRLMDSDFGKQRLQQLIPNWIGRFNTSDLKLENRVKPSLRSTPTAKKISYYNATFEVRYWQKARIHAILLEYPEQTQQSLNYTQSQVKGFIINSTFDPIIQKQITKGLDSSNKKANDYFTSVCNKQGYASIFFDELNPGSKYEMYVTATSPEIYEPTIYSDSISKTEFFTLWNPNLRNKQKLVMNQLKDLRPQMYQAIKQFYENEEKKKDRAKSVR